MKNSTAGARILAVLKFAWKTICVLFLIYAVVFSIAGTAILVYAGVVIVSPVLEVKKLREYNPPETMYMKSQRRELAKVGMADTLQHRFVALDSISPQLVRAVLAAEDDGFYTHPGFDVEAIVAAMEHNRYHTGPKRGASTITQQLAKNLFVGGDKTFRRKYEELAYAVLLEYFLGKQRILELYLNYAQWGKNIFGCEAAAQDYYKKPCSNLTFEQATRLAAVLAMPEKVDPRADQSVFIQKRLSVIANNLYLHNSISDSACIAMGGDDSLVKSRHAADSAKTAAFPRPIANDPPPAAYAPVAPKTIGGSSPQTKHQSGSKYRPADAR